MDSFEDPCAKMAEKQKLAKKPVVKVEKMMKPEAKTKLVKFAVLPKRTKKEVAAKMMGTKPKQKLVQAKTTAKAVLGKLAKPKRMQPKAPPVCQGCDRRAAVDVTGVCPGYCCNCCKRWCAGDKHGFQNRHGKDCSLGILLVSDWKAAGKSHDFQGDLRAEEN